ncbi:thiosulfate:glutathione sulfurtransferase-like, partial [Pelobates fuscus]|uniref:thiosulfate:glutathione sulfurtransferase-like n=1 Tax=Pelobates fuscus TaxID=191477 RepID=UPI002FE4CE53
SCRQLLKASALSCRVPAGSFSRLLPFLAETITCDELKNLNPNGIVQLYDVRTPEEVQKGKISNAINIPVTEFEDAFKMDPETFAKKFKINKPKLDDNIIVYCLSGRRGTRATEIASSLGYKHVRNLIGGYTAWSEKEGK